MSEAKNDDSNDSKKEDKTCPPSGIPDGKHLYFKLGWLCTPLAVVVGCFHFKDVSAGRQTRITYGLHVICIVPLLVVAFKHVGKGVV